MTISTINNRQSYAGNGVTVNFSYPNRFLADEDLVVIERDNTTGVETPKTLTTHYTVTGAGGSSGGTVTMLSAPATGKTLVIYQDPDPTQDMDLVENDAFPAENLEEVADRVTIQIQRLRDRMDRAVHLSDGFSPTFDPTLPVDLDDSANKVPLINSGGDGFADAADWPTATDVANAQTNAASAAASASAAATSASSAASSATAAQTAADAALWGDVVFLTVADSPYTIPVASSGKLYAVDASGGPVTINLPSIAALDLVAPFAIGIKKTDSSGNAITVARNGTDTIDSLTSKTITVPNSGSVFIPDTDPAPDAWTSADFGAQAGNLTVDLFSGDNSTVNFTLAVSPGTRNNTFVFINGVYQQKDTYSVSGTTLTFTTAPPLGTNNIQVVSGTTLSVGTPSDGTVTRAKLATGAVAPVNLTASKTSNYTATTSDDIVRADASGGSFTVTLPSAATAGAGFRLEVRRTDKTYANTVTIARAGVDTINWPTTGGTSLKLCTQHESFVLVSDGTSAWIVEDHSYPRVIYDSTSTINGVTSNPGKGTIVEDRLTIIREGNLAVVSLRYKQSVAGTAGSGTYLLPLDGLTLDSVLPFSTTGQNSMVGNGRVNAAGSDGVPAIPAYVFAYNSTNLGLAYNTVSAGNLTSTTALVGSANSALNSAFVHYYFNAIVPIANWER